VSSKTKIEWTDASWNPILGCSRVSDPGKEIPIHCSTGGLMHHAGKKAAGSLLDGVEHKAFPEAR
jgi:protein gp37